MKTESLQMVCGQAARILNTLRRVRTSLVKMSVVLGAVSAVCAADWITFEPVGTHDTEGYAFGVVVSGHYAYVADGVAGLAVFDILDPTSPRRAGGVDTGGSAQDVTVQGGYAYVADSAAGLQIIDISNPEVPQWVGEIDTSGTARRVAVSGNYAYVADGNTGLQVIDVSEPWNLRHVGGYDTGGNAYDVALSGDYAYVADAGGGLQVIDVSNPANPQAIGVAQPAGAVSVVALGGTCAYVGIGRGALQVIDISDPAQPQFVSQVPEATGIVWATVIGDLLFTAQGSSGFQVLYLTDPVHPARVGGYGASARALAFAESGDYIYAAAGGRGLDVLLMTTAPAVFAEPSYSVNEDQPTITVAVSRTTWAPDGAFAADYWTEDGTATRGEDYVEGVGSLYFGPDDSSKTIELSILNDAVTERLETFVVQLGVMDQGVPVRHFSSNVISITDNDLGIRFTSAQYSVSEAGGEVVLTVLRGNDVDLSPFTVGFATTNGTAMGDGDYLAVSGVLEFAEGELEQVIVVPILNDALNEADEGFSVMLSNPIGPGNLGNPSQVTVTIQDNDLGIRFTGGSASVSEEGAELALAVLRGNDVDLGPFAVVYATEDATAIAGEDYVATSGVLEFAEGETERTIVVPILNDALNEDSESFTVTLSDPIGPGNLGSPAVATVTIADNDPGMGFDQVSYAFREDAGKATLTVLRGNDVDLSPISVDFSTSDGTAVAGEDYLATSGTLMFGEGEEKQTITVHLLDDRVAEQQESFSLTLRNPIGEVSLGHRTTCTIAIEVNDARVLLGQVAALGMTAIRLVDAWGVEVVGQYAYVGDGSAGLRIIDVSDPHGPLEVGHCATSGLAYDLAVAGHYVYVVGGGTNLLIVDVSDPRDPKEVGSWYAGTNGVSRVAVQDAYAYLAEGEAGLQVIDISEPMAPRKVGDCTIAEGARAVAVEGIHAFVADGRSSLQVIDIRDPANPVWVSQSDPIGKASWPDMAVSGRYVYLTTSEGLTVIDVMDPGQPQVMATVGLSDAVDVTLSGGYAYVAHSGGLAVIDISDPANPVQVGNSPTQSPAWGVAVSGSYVYVTDWSMTSQGSWFYVMDISTPSDPRVLGGPPNLVDGASDVALAGEYAYVTAWVPNSEGACRLLAINVADLANPVLAGTMEEIVPYMLASQGGYAYVAGWGSLTTIDLSDPAHPKRLGICDIGASQPEQGWISDFVLSGDHAYLVARYLTVVNIADPTNPTWVGGLTLDAVGRSIAFRNGYVYVAGNEGRLHVIDVGDPAHPVSVGSLTMESDAEVLAVAGDYVLLATGSEALLRIIDISDPTHPMPVATLSTESDIRDIALSGGHAFLGGPDGLQVINIHDPRHPRWVGGYECPSVNAVAVSGDDVFLATQGGLLILRATEVPAFGSFTATATEITLHWNRGAAGMVLQHTLSLENPDWQDLLGSENTNSVTLPIWGGTEFFRLVKP